MGFKDISQEGIFQAQRSFGGELNKFFITAEEQMQFRSGSIKSGINVVCGQSETVRSRLGTKVLCVSRHPMFTVQVGLYTIIFKGVKIHDHDSTEDDEIFYSIYYDSQPLSSKKDAFAYVENLDRTYVDNSEDIYTKNFENVYYTAWTKFTMPTKTLTETTVTKIENPSDPTKNSTTTTITTKKTTVIDPKNPTTTDTKITTDPTTHVVTTVTTTTTMSPRLDFNKLQHYSVLVESRDFWRIGFYFGIVDYHFDLSSQDPKYNKFVALEFVPKRTEPKDNEYLLDQISDFSLCIMWENALLIADKGYLFISVDAGIQVTAGTPVLVKDARYDFNTIYASVEETNIKETVFDGTSTTPTAKNYVSIIEGAYRLQFTGKGTIDNVITNLFRFRDLIVVSTTNHIYKIERMEKNNAYSSINYASKLIYNEGCKRNCMICDFNKMYFVNVQGLYMVALKEGLTLDISSDVYVVSIYSQHFFQRDIIKLGLRRYRGDANFYMYHLDGEVSVVSMPTMLERAGATNIPRITSRTPKNSNKRYNNDYYDFYYYICSNMFTTVVARFFKDTGLYEFPHPYYTVEREIFPDTLHDNRTIRNRYDFDSLRNYTFLDCGHVFNGCTYVEIKVVHNQFTMYSPKFAKLKIKDTLMKRNINVTAEKGDKLILIDNSCSDCGYHIRCATFESEVIEQTTAPNKEGTVTKTTVTIGGDIPDGKYILLGISVIRHFKEFLKLNFDPRKLTKRLLSNVPLYDGHPSTASNEEDFTHPIVSHVAYMNNFNSRICVMTLDKFLQTADTITTTHIAVGIPFAREITMFSHGTLRSYTSISNVDLILADTESVYCSETDIDHSLIPFDLNNTDSDKGFKYNKSVVHDDLFADIYKTWVEIPTNGRVKNTVKDIGYSFTLTASYGQNIHILGYSMQIISSKK